MSNQCDPEELAVYREDFLRYLETSGGFFEAYTNLRDELDKYMSAWEGVETRAITGRFSSLTNQLDDLLRKLKEVTRGLMDINEQIEELKNLRN